MSPVMQATGWWIVLTWGMAALAVVLHVASKYETTHVKVVEGVIVLLMFSVVLQFVSRPRPLGMEPFLLSRPLAHPPYVSWCAGTLRSMRCSLGTQYCWYVFGRAPGRAHPDLRLRFFLVSVYLLIGKFMKPLGPSRDRDGNGGSALGASPSWWASHQMLSLSFVYSDSQASGTAYCCRVLFNAVEGVRSKRLAPLVTDHGSRIPRAKSQDAVAGLLKRRQPCPTG